MENLKYIVDLFLHVDKNLSMLIQNYGFGSNLILFLVIFMETGLVVTPFLPGDSLLFAAGALAAKGDFNLWGLWLLMLLAAFLGDTVNYWIGHFIGPKAFDSKSKLLKREYLDKAQSFYDKYGGKAIVLARFVPIVRTFAPFVAGIGKMDYGKFLSFNAIGGFVWVTAFVMGGYLFGGIPIIKNNFHWTVVVIVLISVVPIVIEVVKAKKEKRGR